MLPRRSARILICFNDSSPEIYRTFFCRSASALHICNNNVDFPIPGSPPTNTREPTTIPPPNTRSNSSILVLIRSSSMESTSCNVFGTSATIRILVPVLVVFATGSSTNASQVLQPGHCPSHLPDSNPHSLQKKTVFFFAIHTPIQNP